MLTLYPCVAPTEKPSAGLADMHNIAAARDEDGYLLDLSDWTVPVAAALAMEQGIALTAAHWEVLNALRVFYQQFGLSPAMRPLCKYLKETLGTEKSGSLYLLQLFPERPNAPESPARIAARIAGLPKPENCL